MLEEAIKQTANIDLGDTSIENIFINDFMPMANGTYVKVYLLGYKYATDKDSSIHLNHKTISRHLNLPLSDILNAWDFWERKGIIKIALNSGGDDAIHLTIADNGIGIPETVDIKNPNTLGLQLVQVLVENQLNGELTVDNKNGTKYSIRFKKTPEQSQ